MKRKKHQRLYAANEIMFHPALTPLEAAILPARDLRPTGALRMAKAAFNPDARREANRICCWDQRANIWVR